MPIRTKRLAVIIVLAMIIPIIWIIDGIYYFTSHNIKPMRAILYYAPPPVEYVDRDYAIKVVNEFIPYIYKLEYIDFSGTIVGQAVPVVNIVKIDKDLSGWEALYTLTHELVHLKYNTHNETYTTFTAFKLMYESGNPLLVKRAKYFIYEQCSLAGWRGTAYDVSGYIFDYLIKRGEV